MKQGDTCTFFITYIKDQMMKAEEETIIELYKHNFLKTAALVQKLGGDLETAKDIFHDAMIVYLEKSRLSTSEIKSPEAYLVGVVKILWVKKYGGEKKHVQLDEYEKAILLREEDYKEEDDSAYLLFDWQWQKAFNALQKAVQLNPSAVEAYELLGFYYVIIGQKEKALEVLEEAERIDPLSPVIAQSLGDMYTFCGRYDDTIRQADKVLEMHLKMRICIEMKGWATGIKGDWQEALKYFEEVHRLTNHPLKGLMGIAFAYGKLGRREEALECIRKMEQRQIQEPDSVIDADLAAAWFGLGDLDKTFYYINQCIEKRVGPVTYFLEYPAYDGIKNDPRYYDLKAKMNLS